MMSAGPLFARAEEEAIKARDAGIQQTSENNSEWMALALCELRNIASNPGAWRNLEQGFTGEDIRMMIAPRVGNPISPHAWGALIATAVRRKIILFSGRYGKMKSEKSHARETRLYLFA